jgi:hypothetical protein
MSHGPNRFRAERNEAGRADQIAAGTTPPGATRAQRVIAAWNVRARRRETADFFPTFATALAAGTPRLTYLCPACQRLDHVDLQAFADAHHPRAPISVVIPKLSCEWCCPNPPLAVLIEIGRFGQPIPTVEHEAPNEPRGHTDPRDYPAPPVPTMEHLPAHGVKELIVWCGRWPHSCSHTATVAVSAIDLKQTIVEFASALSCPDCGHRGGQVMPRWPNAGRGPGGAHSLGAAPVKSAEAIDRR